MKRSRQGFWIVLAACSPGAWAGDAPAAPNASIQAFIDICVKHAPSFAGAGEAALGHGITELVGPAGDQAGFTADSSLGVQIKADSCTVTTDVQKDRKLTQKLLEAVARHTGQAAGKTVPLQITLGGEEFALMHNRAGGEAFVLLSLKR
jgi:hypothetical protein